jgi:hypothetical protein
MAECRHLIEESTCGDCTPRRGGARLGQWPGPGQGTMGPWFQARRNGECDECEGEIMTGDTIRSDGEGGWLCRECGHDEEAVVSTPEDLGLW